MCGVFLVWEHSKTWVNSRVGKLAAGGCSSESLSLCLMGDAGCQLEPQQGYQNTHGLLMRPGLPIAGGTLGMGSAFMTTGYLFTQYMTSVVC